LSLAEESGTPLLARNGNEVLADLHESLGRYEDALAAHNQYKAAHDSLFNSESQSVIAELQEQYRTREQRQRIEILQREQEIQRLWVFGLAVGLLLVALVAGLAYSRYRFKHRTHQALSEAHRRLKAAQQQLVHAEKMASLGALTAGIAHEIRNPLNFVNNFADLNADLADEIIEVLEADPGRTPDQLRLALAPILADLKENAAHIGKHGKRANGIVQAMMQHAGGRSGSRTPTDLNKLITDYTRIAYDSMQNQNEDFHCKVVFALDEDLPAVEAFPRELSRVVLNLLGNAFYAAHERARNEHAPYVPTVRVVTQAVRGGVAFRVEDNGAGIPFTVRDRIFEPFYTTKPTGQGSTGLGLSLAYDIVTQGHSGTLTLESELGRGAAFTVTLPLLLPAAPPVLEHA
jgi:signal transduction histidine kinase